MSRTLCASVEQCDEQTRDIDTMLRQRLRSRANTKPALDKRL